MQLKRTVPGLGLGLVACVIALSAQANPSADRVRDLNREVLRLHSDKETRSLARRSTALSETSSLIEERGFALSALIREDPAQALSLAFPPELLSALAADFPEAASSLEAHATWQGPVEHYVLDNLDGTSRSEYRMRWAQENLEVHFSGGAPNDCASGSTLRIDGVRAGSRVAVASSGQLTAATGCTTTGIQNIAVLLVTFPGVNPPAAVTPQIVNDVFFATSGRSLNGYWREASYGATSAAGSVFGWYTLDRAYGCAEMDLLRDAAIRAAMAQVDFQNYTRVFIVLPSDLPCSWSGMATQGCSLVNSPSGSFTASTTFLMPSYFSDHDRAVMLVTHEAGHNLLLHHGSWRDFGAEALGPVVASGSIVEYGDNFSTMGFWNLGGYSAPHKAEVLNWMTSGTNYQIVQSSGAWSLQPLSVNPAGLQALKVRRGTADDAWLWIEYRQPAGSYDPALLSQVFSGALIHYQDSSTGRHTHLLDFTPETETWGDPALTVGKTWVDPYTNLSISVQSATANALTVNVSYGPAICTHANPSVTISPANLTIAAGSNATYTVMVTNRDSAGCPSSVFTLNSSQPVGWPGSFSATTLSLSAGQTGSVTMTRTAPASAMGTYTVNATAASGTFAASGTANCSVTTAAQFTATLSVSGVNYALGQPVPLTVLATGNGSAGATVSFTVRKPDGGSATKKIRTDSAGKAEWVFTTGPRDPVGTYSAVATVVSRSATALTDPVTFYAR